MKISNSKKELARIISENGGWRDGAKWSVQQKTGGRVVFTKSKYKPEFNDGCWDGFGTFYGGFVTHKALPNWHQCILSSEEYFHLYPAPDPDGWVEWHGEPKSPVDKGILVDVKMKDGTCNEAQILDDENWGHCWGDGDIIAYRLHKLELAQPQSPVEMAFDIIKQGVNAETKPTIEQLAADYRNRKNYADRKQEEADAAKADAEAKLAELVAAGMALNLVIGVSEEEPELVITDWRDLRLGDIIEYVDGAIKEKIGMTGPVVEFEPYATDGMHVRLKCDNGTNKGILGWPTKWKFIRRP